MCYILVLCPVAEKEKHCDAERDEDSMHGFEKLNSSTTIVKCVFVPLKSILLFIARNLSLHTSILEASRMFCGRSSLVVKITDSCLAYHELKNYRVVVATALEISRCSNVFSLLLWGCLKRGMTA
ncbi:hypothetical protein TNCV_4537141 [Trichonephila clavipes]|nr:hypothetical protein TNCV_4537141 [Trichonephila clavipes]